MNWCRSHPSYSAKRAPNSLCGDCWQLYFYRCPEERTTDPVTQADVEWAESALRKTRNSRRRLFQIVP